MDILTGTIHSPARLQPPAPAAPPVQQPLEAPQHPLDTVARQAQTHALQLSALVYDDAAHVLEQLQEAGFSEGRFHSGRYGGQCLCGIRDGIAYIAFRGTSSSLDWMMNLLLLPAYCPARHFGFEKTWRHLRGNVEAWLDATAPAAIVLTGHSLGGAMAHLAALHLAFTYRIQNVFTFGAPKACYLGTATRYNRTPILGETSMKLGDVTWCAIHQRDIVARVPFGMLGYRDVGHLIYIDVDNGLNYGEAAAQQRSTDSLRDTDFLLKFLDVESAAIAGYDAKPGSVAWLRHGLARCCQFSDLIKFPVALVSVYVLVVSYLLRSGLAHLSANYESALLPAFTRHPRRQVPSRMRALFATVRLVVLSSVILVLFLWGLKILGVFIWNAFTSDG